MAVFWVVVKSGRNRPTVCRCLLPQSTGQSPLKRRSVTTALLGAAIQKTVFMLNYGLDKGGFTCVFMQSVRLKLVPRLLSFEFRVSVVLK
jgi:hypothetical protein